MSRRVAFIDTTLRDGQQALWATRMTTPMILGALPHLKRAGYDVIEVMGAVTFDACIRYLNENPWERLRLMRHHLAGTPLRLLTRCRGFISFDMMPDDIIELVYTRLYANGIRQLMPVDGLHDMDNVRFAITLAKRVGFHVCAPLTFSISPVHTDDYYVRKGQESLALGADALVLKDVGGLLTMDRVRTLVPALRQVAGERPLEIHSHCSTGLAPLVLLEAVSLGVDAVYTAIPPLADGPSHPSVFNVAENLKLMGYEVALDLDALREASAFLTAVADNEGLPVGQAVHYDLFHYQHQVPGGMITNMSAQMKALGLEHKLREALEEIPRMRAELAWPVMVSPFSQIVGTQAVLNVVQGERYQTVMDEIAKWAYGYYGKLEAPIDPDVMDRIAERASRRISPQPQAPEPMLPTLRSAYPQASDDELVLRAFFKGTQVDDVLAAPPIKTTYEFEREPARLVKHLVAVTDTGRVVLSKADLEVAWQR